MPSDRAHGIANVVSQGRFSSASSVGSRRSSSRPAPKPLDPVSERKYRTALFKEGGTDFPYDDLERTRCPVAGATSSAQRLAREAPVVAQLHDLLGRSEDKHVRKRHATVCALAEIPGALDPQLVLPKLVRLLATHQRFTEPPHHPPRSLAGRFERSFHSVAYEILLDLSASQKGRQAITHLVLDLAAVGAAPATTPARQSSIGANPFGVADDEPKLINDADGGGQGLLKVIRGRLAGEADLSAVRLVASIDVALRVTGDDVRAENERLRSEADDARADADDARAAERRVQEDLAGAARRHAEDLEAAERQNADAVQGMAAKLRESDDAADALSRERDELKKRRESDESSCVDLFDDEAPPPKRKHDNALRELIDEQQLSTLKKVKAEKGAAVEDAEDAQETLGYQVRTTDALQTKIDELAGKCDEAGRLAGEARDAVDSLKVNRIKYRHNR